MARQKSKTTAKILQITYTDKMGLLAHDFAKESYALFCEFYDCYHSHTSTIKSENRVVKLIKHEHGYYFFDDYEYMMNVGIGDTMYVQLVDYDTDKIRQLGWQALLDYMAGIRPVSPMMIRRFIERLPDDVVIESIKGKITIASLLDYFAIGRHTFDYQDKKRTQAPFYNGIPTFKALIKETLDAYNRYR